MIKTVARSAHDALAWQQSVIREILPNGLTLLIRRDTSAPVVAIVTHVKAGYFDESDDIIGIAHVLEHMYFKGTPTRGVGAIARETKANGGYLNAHTIYDHTSYYTVLPSSAFEQGLEIQFDAYAHSVIDAGELARELEVIVQEARRKRDSAGAVAIESLYALLHDHHRIRRWRIGEDEALRTFTRDQLVAFYRHWYQPSNTVLSIVGDIDPDTVRTAVLERYGKLPAGTPAHVAGPQERMAPAFRVREWTGDIAQTQIALGWRTPALNHPDTPLLDMAATAIGTGRASRLYRAARERGFASSVGAYDYTAGDVGVFVVQAEAPPPLAREALLQMWREVQSARENGLRRSEIMRAQSIIEARWLRRLDSMDGQASYLASWEADGGLELAIDYYDRLMSLTVTDVEGALARHLRQESASIIAYRPSAVDPLAESADELRSLLRTVEGAGSSVLPPPATPTPSPFPAVKPADIIPRAHVETVQSGVHVFRTDYGIPVLVLPRPGSLITNVGVFARGGASVEPSDRNGLARLAVQSSLKGTERRSGARVAEVAEELGGSIGVSAGLENVGWAMSIPTRHLKSAIELLADVVQHAEFAEDAVDTERSLAMAEVERLRDDMYRWPMRLATQAAYGTHPYSHAVLGTERSLGAINAAAIRAFHAQNVLVGPVAIGIVGDVTPAEVAQFVARQFDNLEWRDDTPPPAHRWQRTTSVCEDTRNKQQTALAMLFEGPGRLDASRYASHVLSVIASGLGGRFFEQLRDKQSLAYTVAAYGVERRTSGAFAAYIATAPEREAEAREGLLAEFAKLRVDLVSAEELRRAKTYLIGTHAIAQQSGASVLGDVIDAWLFGAGLVERDTFVAEVQRVTPQDVRALAERYFDPSRRAEGIVRGTGA
ncbi:MAG: insulinase family protein [Phycisphaerae bacterium]|nr:insulinase family protein [Gemmatimonadaceae bacterium]